MNKPQLILKAIKEKLIPLTEKEVAAGNHLFGGLVLDKESCQVITAGSNKRQENPIYHGEIDTINRFFAASGHPDPADCIFVASHDPCPMCISAISWAGFREIWVLFGYDDVKTEFGMPVDLMMYKEIFGAEGARSENKYFRKFCLKKEAAKQENAAELMKEIAEINKRYAKMRVQDFDYPGM